MEAGATSVLALKSFFGDSDLARVSRALTHMPVEQLDVLAETVLEEAKRSPSLAGRGVNGEVHDSWESMKFDPNSSELKRLVLYCDEFALPDVVVGWASRWAKGLEDRRDWESGSHHQLQLSRAVSLLAQIDPLLATGSACLYPDSTARDAIVGTVHPYRHIGPFSADELEEIKSSVTWRRDRAMNRAALAEDWMVPDNQARTAQIDGQQAVGAMLN